MKPFLFLFILPLLFSCSVSKNYNPNKKYSKETLQQDYSFLRNVLEQKHPSLYWYTPKDSMNYYFDEGYKSITDSMTELQFGWKIIAPLTAAIHCGHTSFSMSKGWNKFIKNKQIPSFPLYLKIWGDTMVVLNNLNPKDSVIKRGTIVTSINGLKTQDLVSRMFDFMAEDGYSNNVNYIRLSASFPYFHRNIFGIYKTYNVGYLDKNGLEQNIQLPYFAPPADSLSKSQKNITGIKKKKFTKKERLENIRSLNIKESTATMVVNSFSKSHMHHFFKSSFRKLKKEKVDNLVVDIRANGGGNIDNSVLLTKYLRNSSFKVADSAYAVSKSFQPFTRNITSGLFNDIGLLFITHKKQDGKYHFGFWERHTFRPKRRNHFNGNVYVLTNGLTFSASTLFCNAVKGQQNVTLVGEETGGGWYGNSGIVIPDIILPETRLHVRLPFFRLVQYHHIANKGTGVIPDVYVGPNVKDIINQVDTKMEKVEEMIRKKAK